MTFVPIDRVAAWDYFASLVTAKTDTSGGLCGITDFIGDGRAFGVLDDDKTMIAVFVIQKIQRAHGIELEVRAALQLSKRGDLTETVLPEIERAFAHDCDMMTVYTKRAGLVRKLQSAGYHEAAKIMQKRVSK